MHRVLHIQEILQQIFDNFLPPFKTVEWVDHHDSNNAYGKVITAPLVIPAKEEKNTLLSAALTCRSFAGPALDALWWAMDDVTPLFNVLSGFSQTNSFDKILGSISDSDLKTFNSYAERIKLYYFQGEENIAQSAYSQVLQACGRFYLLPSLRYLRCTENLPTLLFFQSPILRAFYAVPRHSQESSTPEPPFELITFVNLLSKYSPNISLLNLRYPLTEKCLAAVNQLTRLKHLTLSNVASLDPLYIRSTFLQAVLSRSTLNTAYFRGYINFDLSAFEPPLSFSSITKLNLTPWRSLISITQATNLLRIATFEKLLYLALRLSPHSVQKDSWYHFFQQVNADSHHIEFLNLSGSTRNLIYWEKPQLNISTCDLQQVRLLRLKSLAIRYLFPINEANVATIITLCPNLTILDLYNLRSIVTIGFPTLVELAKGLPQLQVLNIMLDCRNYPPNPENFSLSVNHPLKKLFLGSSLVLDAVTFAFAIDKLFPNLNWTCDVDGSCADYALWVAVGPILKGLQLARKDQTIRDQQIKHVST